MKGGSKKRRRRESLYVGRRRRRRRRRRRSLLFWAQRHRILPKKVVVEQVIGCWSLLRVQHKNGIYKVNCSIYRCATEAETVKGRTIVNNRRMISNTGDAMKIARQDE